MLLSLLARLDIHQPPAISLSWSNTQKSGQISVQKKNCMSRRFNQK